MLTLKRSRKAFFINGNAPAQVRAETADFADRDGVEANLAQRRHDRGGFAFAERSGVDAGESQVRPEGLPVVVDPGPGELTGDRFRDIAEPRRASRIEAEPEDARRRRIREDAAALDFRAEGAETGRGGLERFADRGQLRFGGVPEEAQRKMQVVRGDGPDSGPVQRRA